MRNQPSTGSGAIRTHEFRTDDLDEATDFLFRNFGPNARTVRKTGPLGFHLSASITPRAASGYTRIGVGSTLRAATRWVTMHLPSQHEAEYRVGRRQLRSRPDVALLLAPGHEYTRSTPPGYEQAIQIEPGLLQLTLDDCLPAGFGARAVQSLEIPMTQEHRAAFAALTKAHADGAAVQRRGAGCADLDVMEHRMARWVAGRIAEVSGAARLSRSSREAAERVEAWIRVHFPHPIELEQLCAVAGVVGRTLQKACDARWGQSPFELVASRRLAHARVLLSTLAVSKVTDAAVRSGFTHLGRFSTLYRQSYGESPSETLARAREASGVPSLAVSSRNRPTSRAVTGPERAEPIVRPSTRVTEASSPMVPEQNISSAR
jgi:AraC-like DNA-binding protein